MAGSEIRKGLILEGGALRGLFTAGVLDVFMENGITFDGAVGVSAGVAFGCNFKSHQIGRVLRYNLKYHDEWRFKSFRSLFLTGDLYGADFCYHRIPEELDPFDTETFKNDPMDFYAVMTDVVTGMPYYRKLYDGGPEDCEWIRASASMPLASRIVKIGGGRYLDGGITDSIPLQFMESTGYNRNVVILTQPDGYVKDPYNIMPLVKTALHRYPKTVDAIGSRHTMYNEQTAYVRSREKEGEALVIRPPFPLGIKPLEKDPGKMQQVYDTGRSEGGKSLARIKEYLGE